VYNLRHCRGQTSENAWLLRNHPVNEALIPWSQGLLATERASILLLSAVTCAKHLRGNGLIVYHCLMLRHRYSTAINLHMLVEGHTRGQLPPLVNILPI
jgi:hypothetical protein